MVTKTEKRLWATHGELSAMVTAVLSDLGDIQGRPESLWRAVRALHKLEVHVVRLGAPNPPAELVNASGALLKGLELAGPERGAQEAIEAIGELTSLQRGLNAW
jgi:hypothetical protein